MAHVIGSTLFLVQGENPDLIFNIVDSDGNAYDLTGGEAVISIRQPDGTAVNKTCSIATTTATAAFAHAETAAMSATTYPFQFWCRNAAGKIVMTKNGTIKVNAATDAEAVAP